MTYVQVVGRFDHPGNAHKFNKMENLVGKIAAYERCVQGLLDKIHAFAKEAQESIPAPFLIDLEFRNFWGEWHVCADGNLIPTSVEKCATDFYWGGNFDRLVCRASRKQVVEFAKNLPALIKKAEKLAEERLAEVENL